MSQSFEEVIVDDRVQRLFLSVRLRPRKSKPVERSITSVLCLSI